MRYDILRAASPIALVQMVNERLAEGWKPIGGVVYQRGDYTSGTFADEDEFYQAVLHESFAPLGQRIKRSE